MLRHHHIGSTNTISYSVTGSDDPKTSALHIALGEEALPKLPVYATMGLTGHTR